MAKKEFKIRVKFVFTGEAKVMAHDRKEAEATAEKDLRPVIDRERLASLLLPVDRDEETVTGVTFNGQGVTVVSRQERRRTEEEVKEETGKGGQR